MAADKKQLEEWIRLENKLAQELLNSDPAARTGKYSEVYEAMYSEFPPERRAEMNARYRAAARAQHAILGKIIGRGRTVLDIGCGFGNLASLLAEDGNQVVGIDINGLHVEECKAAWAHLKNARFEKTSGVALAFPDNHFDYAVSTSVFEHIHPDDVARHLAEVRRVLKPGGAYLFNGVTPYGRGDLSAFSSDASQRESHGFHINETTWREMARFVRAADFSSWTTVLPVRVEQRLPGPAWLVPMPWKAWAERLLPLGRWTLRVFRLNNQFVVARKPRS